MNFIIIVAALLCINALVFRIAYRAGWRDGDYETKKFLAYQFLVSTNFDEQYVFGSGYCRGASDALGYEIATAADIIQAYEKWKQENPV